MVFLSSLPALNSNLLKKVALPDYSNVLGTIKSSGDFTIDTDCYIIGYIKSPSTEGSYLKYGGSDGTTLFNTVSANTVIPIMMIAQKGEAYYIRGGATVSLTKYGLK